MVVPCGDGNIKVHTLIQQAVMRYKKAIAKVSHAAAGSWKPRPSVPGELNMALSCKRRAEFVCVRARARVRERVRSGFCWLLPGSAGVPHGRFALEHGCFCCSASIVCCRKGAAPLWLPCCWRPPQNFPRGRSRYSTPATGARAATFFPRPGEARTRVHKFGGQL